MIEIGTGAHTKLFQSTGETAKYLEKIVNEHAALGWEFYRIDKFTATESAGCGCLGFLLSVFGRATDREIPHYVATFRATVEAPTSQDSAAPT
ncbi:MAG: DUF4177 domain-containing protein [Chlorobia bacterium]|nr:DUF4177 domain-containing protein [Fimbriimonadaceae bacterium]